MCLLDRFLNFIDRLFNHYALIRRTLLVWCVYEVHRTIDVFIEVLRKMDEVTAPVATVITAIFLLVGTVTKFYIDSRTKGVNGETK